MDVCPMLIPMSNDFGSVNVKLIARGKECRVNNRVLSIRGQLQNSQDFVWVN